MKLVKFSRQSCNSKFKKLEQLCSVLWPVYTGDFCCDFSGDFKRDFAAIWIASSLHGRFEIAAKIAAKIASVNGPLNVDLIEIS